MVVETSVNLKLHRFELSGRCEMLHYSKELTPMDLSVTEYDVYSEFNANEHAKHFICYLEVVLHPDGSVEYAVPSHSEKLIAIACQQFEISRDELYSRCPDEYAFNVIQWLCNLTHCVAVWYEYITCPEHESLTSAQLDTLRQFKAIRVYAGEIPEK